MRGPLVLLRALRPSDTNLVVALAALVTSVVAVAIAWDEARVIREAYRTAFSPVLEVEAKLAFAEDGLPGDPSSAGALTITARNVGPGVASLQGVTVTAGGEAVTDWPAFSAALLTPFLAREARFGEANDAVGYLKPDEDETLLSLSWPKAQFVRIPLGQHLAEGYPAARAAFVVEACYCSLFEECWTVSTEAPRPEPVKRCEAGGEEGFAAIARSYRVPTG